MKKIAENTARTDQSTGKFTKARKNTESAKTPYTIPLKALLKASISKVTSERIAARAKKIPKSFQLPMRLERLLVKTPKESAVAPKSKRTIWKSATRTNEAKKPR